MLLCLISLGENSFASFVVSNFQEMGMKEGF
jgi:hypothetical protein